MGMLGDPLSTRVPEVTARKRPIHAGSGISLYVFDHYEAPKNPLGAAAGAGQLGASKGLII